MSANSSPMMTSAGVPVQLFNKNTQAIIYNFKPEPVQRMLDFDYLCKRKIPSIGALVSPGAKSGYHKCFSGNQEILLPVYGSLKEACRHVPKADVLINFASFRSAYDSSLDALEQYTIRTVVIIAEGVPEREIRKLIAIAKRKQKIIIGPATVGGIQAGAFKIGDTAGTSENIVNCKLYRPGSVGFVSKSGGLSNEMYNILSKTTDGLFEGIAIGGDVYPGSQFIDHILRFEMMPEVKIIVMLGELGGRNEYGVVEALQKGLIKKPLVAWVSGTCAKMFPTEVQFGHAGAKSGSQEESAEAKCQALREAGAIVPTSFEGLAECIAQTYQGLVSAGLISHPIDVDPPELPLSLNEAIKAGKIRKPTGIVSTICDDRGDEPTYVGYPVSKLIEDQVSVGDIICLLWFKKRLPSWATKFIEMVLILTADHGPCVSGAHNSIVAARAGKDLVSCLASGLLTIGPRFGGAIDDAARYFKQACDDHLEPDAFVESMKKQGKHIPGIGHKIKSRDNPDQRVVMLKKYANEHFPSVRYLSYALEVEQYTLTKGNNLILNVDGCIGALFLDLMNSCSEFSETEMNEIVEIGYLNGLFVLARSIGLIAHVLDQKRLRQPLYRHPMDDVLYAAEF